MTNQDTTSIDEQIINLLKEYSGYDLCGSEDCLSWQCAKALVSETKALISDQVAKARKRTAEEIFYILWEEDGSYFQYDDPPKEMLDYLATLNGVKNK